MVKNGKGGKIERTTDKFRIERGKESEDKELCKKIMSKVSEQFLKRGLVNL